MTIREYYKLNKEVSKSIFKILGVVFTSILAIVFLIFVMDSKRELIDGLYVFILCFILGNFLGLSIFSFLFVMGFSQFNSQRELFTRIPSEIKESLGLKLVPKLLESRYSFTELVIIGFDRTSFVFFDYDRESKRVWITMNNIMNDISDFYAKKATIDKKYKKESVFLSGKGLRKEIKWKNWLKMNENEIMKEIFQLYSISEKENIRVYQVCEKINWP